MYITISFAAGCIVLGLPVLMNALYFGCNDVSGCPTPALLEPGAMSWGRFKSQIPWPENGIWGLCSWRVALWVLCYYAVSLALYRILPAQEVYGTKLRESGRPLLYRFNGRHFVSLPFEDSRLIFTPAFSSTVMQLVACAIGTLLYGAHFPLWTFITDNYVQLLNANVLVSLLISVAVYANSFIVREGNPELRELAKGGQTPSPVYNFFIGRELNPRVTLPWIGEIDVKAWLEMRPGLTGWVLLDLAFVAKQYRTYGYLSDSILVLAAAQTYYVLEGQYAEAGLLGMMDITTDGLGFMLSFGDIVWVPFLYSTQCRYLSVYPVHLGWPGVVAVAMVFVAGVYIFRASNSQKRLFRSDPQHPSFTGMSSIATKRGSRLLTGGWWGGARHINYFGDWLQSLPFCLPTGLAGYVILSAGSSVSDSASANMLDGRLVTQNGVAGWGMIFTYFYSFYFGLLLIHRERRDDAACAEKYGEDWNEYKRVVRWRIIPGVY